MSASNTKYGLKRISFLYKWVELCSTLQVRLLHITTENLVSLHLEVKLKQEVDKFSIYEINRSLLELYEHLIDLDCDSVDWLVTDLKPLTEGEVEQDVDTIGEQVYDILSELGRNVIDEYLEKLITFYKSDVGKAPKQAVESSNPVEINKVIEPAPIKGWTGKLMRSLSNRSVTRPLSKISIASSKKSSIYNTQTDPTEEVPSSPTFKPNNQVELRKTLLKVKAEQAVVIKDKLPSPPFEKALILKTMDLEEEKKEVSPLKHSPSLMSRFNSLRLNKKKSSPKLRNKEMFATSLGLENDDQLVTHSAPQSKVGTPQLELNELSMVSPHLSNTEVLIAAPERPKLVRSKTLKERFIGRSNSTKVKPEQLKPSSVDVKVLDGGLIQGDLKLVVNSDISLCKLLKGIRSKATLYGHDLPSFNKLRLTLCNEHGVGIHEVDLTETNFKKLFQGSEVLVKVYLNDECAQFVDSDDESVDGLAVPKHRRNQMSRTLIGLDLGSTPLLKSAITRPSGEKKAAEEPKVENPLYTTIVRNLEEEKIDLDDYLRTPTRTELKYAMQDSVWDSSPKLHLTLQHQPNYQSSTTTSVETTPTSSPSFDSSKPNPLEIPANQASKLTRTQTLAIQNAHPNGKLDMRLQRQFSSPSMQYPNSAKLGQQLKINSNLTSLVQDFKRELLARKHIKLTIRINQDFNIKLDLDIETCTYTSLLNKSITKFSNGGYPLSALHNMDLVFAGDKNSAKTHLDVDTPLDSTIVVDDTKILKQLLINQVNLGHKQVTLLLLPKQVLKNSPRMALRWDHPPNLVQVFKPKLQPN